jgi:hypothetical protein
MLSARLDLPSVTISLEILGVWMHVGPFDTGFVFLFFYLKVVDT